MTAATFDLRDDFAPAGYADWRALVERDLGGAPFDKKLVSRLPGGLEVQPIYLREHAPDDEAAIGLPGLAPLVRGATPLAANGTGWDIRQVVAVAEPAAANAAALAELDGGARSLVVRYHAAARATGRGYQEQEGPADGFVGATADQLARLLDGVLLEAAGVVLDAGAAAPAAAAQLLAVLERRGIAGAQGALGLDPLGVLAASGRLPGGLPAWGGLLAGFARHCAERHPRLRAVTASGAALHEAGADPVLELAATVAAATWYLRQLVAAGLPGETAARQIGLRLSLGCDQFLEIARLRALRRLWSRVLEASGIDSGHGVVQLWAATGERMLTRYDPWVNLLRTTVAGFAAAVGGADAITVAPYDTRLGPSDALARRIARNSQVILHEESHLDQVVDPGGGSWYLENLTADLAARAWTAFQDLERSGGLGAALADGSLQAVVATAWQQRRTDLARRKEPITGVSEFPNLAEELPQRPLGDPAELRAAAAEPATPVELGPDAVAGLLAAARAGAGIDALGAAVAGLGAASVADALPVHHLADDFERLRDAAAGARPKVFLATMGPVAEHTARATWSANFFAAGGIEPVSVGNGFADADAAAAACAESGARIAVICSTDARYPELVPPTAAALKAAGVRSVILAGRPKPDDEAAWRAAGVDRFIFLGCPVCDILTGLLREEGVLP